ncbi:methyltransferase, partial [Mesorhizobium sp. M00.F.Ca.ET.149.01.1.1]
MSEPRRKRGAERTSNRGPAAIPQLPPRRVQNPYPPMALLSADQIEAIHQASMHILENFGIEVMSPRALSLFERAGAKVDHGSMNVRIDRGMVEEALKTTRASYTLTPRNAQNAIHLGGNTINFTLVAGPPNVHDMERGRRAGNLPDYQDLVRLAQHFNCIHMLGNQVCAPIELPANTRHMDTYFANLTLTDKCFHVSAIGRGRALDGIEMMAIARGLTLEQMAQEPGVTTIISVNWP